MLVRVYDFITEDKPKFADNLVGIIDDVISFKYTRRAYDIGSFELTIPKNANDADTITPDRMIIVGDNTRYSYIVGTTKKTISGNALYITEVKADDKYINVTGYDLKYLLSFRVTLFPAEEQDKGTYGYYVTSGTTYHCVADLIDYNIVQSTDTDRQIYGMSRLTMLTAQKEAGLTGIQDDKYMTRLEPLTTAIFNILKNCKTHYYEVKLLIDDDKSSPDGYNPHMESGEDKPTIVISGDKYNIRAYTKTDNTSAYKNAIYAVAGNSSDVDTVVKLVKRAGDTAAGVNRKEVVVDVDTDSVSEIDRYALRAAEEYTISDDFEIEPLFYEEFEDEPTLSQKVCIKIGNAVYETIITEITDEYTPSGHKVTYSTGNKKVKVLNVLNRAVAGNTQKIINNKIDMGYIASTGTQSPIINYEYLTDLSVKFNGVTYTAEKDSVTGLISSISDDLGNEFEPTINSGITDVTMHNAAFLAAAMLSGMSPVTGKKLYLYKSGDDCYDITGGWNGRVLSGDGTNNGSFTKNDDSMVLVSSGRGACVFTIVETAEAIDFTDYSKLCAKVLAPTTNASIYCDFGISIVPVTDTYSNCIAVVNSGKSADVITMSIDISDYQGYYYVNLLADLGNTLKVFNVWLEK